MTSAKKSTGGTTAIKESACYAFDTLAQLSGVLRFGALRIGKFEAALWYLELVEPVCAKDVASSGVPDSTTSDTVWLYLGSRQGREEMYDRAEALLNRKVTIRGNIAPCAISLCI